jgi:Cu-Zn family superoxide dismutase
MRKSIAVMSLLVAFGLAGCSSMDKSMSGEETMSHGKTAVTKAVAVLTPTKGNDAYGTVYFMQKGEQVMVRGRLAGLEPGSVHGIHVHQFGNITKADGTAAGGHYNPEGHKHGLPPNTPRHAGDLGNIKANSQGVAKFTKKVGNLTVAGHKNPVIGRGMILHSQEDDGGQPTGNAGARIAQGVIGVSSEK